MVRSYPVIGGEGAGEVPLAQQWPPNPGFYRFALGDFEVVALSDGVVPYETSRVVATTTPAQSAQGQRDMGLTTLVGMSYNAFLVNTGTRVILIDAGSGGAFATSPTFRGTGHLLEFQPFDGEVQLTDGAREVFR